MAFVRELPTEGGAWVRFRVNGVVVGHGMVGLGGASGGHGVVAPVADVLRFVASFSSALTLASIDDGRRLPSPEKMMDVDIAAVRGGRFF